MTAQKNITVTLEIGRISSRKDGSVSMSVETPQLSPEEVALFFAFHGTAVKATLEPLVETQVDDYVVEKDIEKITPSQRLRRILYLEWQQKGATGFFDDFYRRQMEVICETEKQKLE